MQQNKIEMNLWKVGKGLLLGGLSYAIAFIAVEPSFQVPLSVVLTGFLNGLHNYLKHTETFK